MLTPPKPTEYDYTFPSKLIASEPAQPRESARLLVHRRGQGASTITTFAEIGDLLPENAVLVFNETKVIPARFYALRPSGGTVQLLYLGVRGGHIHVLANRPLKLGEVLTARGDGTTCIVQEKLDKGYALTPSIPLSQFESFLLRVGTTPIPPYIKHTRLSEEQLREEYQSVLAKYFGSSAAPTASLHFGESLIRSLEQRGVAIVRVTLHVGLGTFAPLTAAHLESGRLHTEQYFIDPSAAQKLQLYKQKGRPIIAVGTTVVRTLESATRNGQLHELSGETDLFIYPPYQFQFVDGIITNFHVPQSSLLMLVAAFTGKDELFRLYDQAIHEQFHLFSFGDGMLLL